MLPPRVGEVPVGWCVFTWDEVILPLEMKGKFDPDSGIFDHPQTMAMMLIWLFLCMTPVIPYIANTQIANTAHVAGLAERAVSVETFAWFVAFGWRLFRGTPATA